MKTLAILATLAVCSVLTGCSTAGPFVTNISSDGRGGLIIEKNIVHLNGFTGYISTGDNPTTSTIQFIPASALQSGAQINHLPRMFMQDTACSCGDSVTSDRRTELMYATAP